MPPLRWIFDFLEQNIHLEDMETLVFSEKIIYLLYKISVLIKNPFQKFWVLVARKFSQKRQILDFREAKMAISVILSKILF